MTKSKAVKMAFIVLLVWAIAFILYPKLFVAPEQTAKNPAMNTSADNNANSTGDLNPGNSIGVINGTSPGKRALDKALKSNKPTMILFHSNSCIPCKEMSDIVAQIMPDMKDAANFVDVVVDDQAEASLVSEYRVTGIPTSVFFDKTGKNVGTQVGVIDKDSLKEFLMELGK